MSETLRALEGAQRIAGNLGNVIGGNMIRSAESNRADQALKYSLGRQKIQDAQQAELFRRNTEAYEREKADRMRPFNIADIMGSPFALNHLSAKNKNGEMNADGIARILGGKLDKDEKSPTNGQVITPNGVVTREEVKRKWPRLRAYMFQNTNMEKAAEDQIAEAALKMKSAKTPEEIQAYQAEIAKNESFLNDPKQRVAQLQHKIDVLGQLKAVIKDEGIEKDITGLEKKRDKYLDMIEKEKDRSLQRELADKRIRAERAKGRGDKDLRGPFGKLVDDYLRIGKFIDPKYTLEQAKKEAESHQNDPRVSSALMQMLTAIDNSYDMTPEAQKELKKNIYSGLKEIATRHAGPNKKEDPLGIR